MDALIVLEAIAILGVALVGLGICLELEPPKSPKSPINLENRATKASEFFAYYRDLELQALHATEIPDPQPEPLIG